MPTSSNLFLEQTVASKALASSAPKYRLIRDGALNQFFTRVKIGDLLTKHLPNKKPHKVIDLGSGEGSLSAAVGKRWSGVQFVTVDIDPSCTDQACANIASVGTNKHKHIIHDVFDADLPNILDSCDFDIAICNPPFFKPNWKDGFSDVLSKANLLDACQSKTDVSAEILFLAQNLRVLKSGGLLALIVPDGFITGWKMSSLRKELLSKHRIDCVIQLPAHSFHETEARCFILFLTKDGKPKKQVKLLHYDSAMRISCPIYIDPKSAEKRMDYEYHTQFSIIPKMVTLGKLNADIKRGSISMAKAKFNSIPVFHTTNFGDHGAVISLPDYECAHQGFLYAETGDILMARVDRHLHKKISIVKSGKTIISDCVYRIRVAPEICNDVFEALRSEIGIANIQAATKGVGARLISKADLIDLPLQLNADLISGSKKLF